LTESGPRWRTSMRASLTVCPQADGARKNSSASPLRRSRNFIGARSDRHVFVAYLGGVFESGEGALKDQMDVAGGAVALLGDQQIDGDDVLAEGVVVAFAAFGGVFGICTIEQTNKVG